MMDELNTRSRLQTDTQSRFAFSELNDINPERSEWLETITLHGLPFVAYGGRLFGAVDQVPGLFYVSTFFFHIYWFPLFPLGTWLKVLDARGHPGIRSTPIQFSIRSIAFTWLRIVLVIVMVVGVAGGIGGVLESLYTPAAIIPALTLLAMALPAWLFMHVLRGLEIASPARAEELALLAGFPPGAVHDLVNQAVDNEADSQVTVCPNCGRTLANRSRICPRCEWHQT